VREENDSRAVESATGGLISHLITSVPGCSAVFQGSIVSYSNEIKINVVGVKAETIWRHGAVSRQVAQQMATGGRKVLGVDVCIADTESRVLQAQRVASQWGCFISGWRTPAGHTPGGLCSPARGGEQDERGAGGTGVDKGVAEEG